MAVKPGGRSAGRFPPRRDGGSEDQPVKIIRREAGLKVELQTKLYLPGQ
jgi:hypothetical protein